MLWDLTLLIVTLTGLYFLTLRFLNKMSVSIQRKLENDYKLEPYEHSRIPIDKPNDSQDGSKSSKPHNSQDNRNNKSSNAQITETAELNFDFLPKVVDKEEIGDSAAEASFSLDTLDINEDELAFLPLVVDNHEEGGNRNDEVLGKDTKNPDFISLIPNEGSAISGDSEGDSEVNDSCNALHDNKEWYAIDADTNLRSLLNFISLIPDDKDGLNEPAQDQHASLDISSRLPNPVLFDGETFVTRCLLQEIEAFGDCREIPLLKELQLKSDNESVINRIEGIMQEFTLREAKTAQRNIRNYLEEEFSPFSVFEDLFRTCDVEAKLILMDMIVDVGDIKEMSLLKKLCEDPNAQIRTKAITVLQGLENKIFKESLCFDLSETFDIISKERSTNHQDLFKAWLAQHASILNVIKRSIR